MKCPECNRECAEGQKFCEKCGRELVGAGYGEGGADEGIGEGGASPSPVDPPKKRVPRAAIVAIALAAAALLIAGAFFAVRAYLQYADDQEHQTYPVVVSFETGGEDASSMSPVPVRVSGTDFEGNAVEERRCLSAGGSSDQLALMRGTYEIEIVASPISGDGSLFTCPSEPVSVTISDDDGDEASADVEAPKLTLAKRDVRDATDAEIQASVDALVECGLSSAEASEYGALATEKRDEVIAEERQAAIDEFQAQLDSLDNAPDESTYMTQMEMNLYASEKYVEYDDLLNDVYDYLLGVLSEDEAETLQSEEAAWVNEREAAMDKVYYENGTDPMTGEFTYYTMAPLMEFSEGMTWTSERIQVLIDKIPLK